MNYIEAKAAADRLRADLDAASRSLDVFPRGPMGLTPDAVKATPEWKTAKSAADLAFARLRAFNAVYVKSFKREIAADRKARYSAIPA